MESFVASSMLQVSVEGVPAVVVLVGSLLPVGCRPAAVAGTFAAAALAMPAAVSRIRDRVAAGMKVVPVVVEIAAGVAAIAAAVVDSRSLR